MARFGERSGIDLIFDTDISMEGIPVEARHLDGGFDKAWSRG